MSPLHSPILAVFHGWPQRCHYHHHCCPKWEGACFLILLSTFAINPADFICLLSCLRNCLVFRRADWLPFYSTAFVRSAQVGTCTFINVARGLCPPVSQPWAASYTQEIWLLREEENQSRQAEKTKGSWGDCRNFLGIMSEDWIVHRRLDSLAFKKHLTQGTRALAQTNKHFSHGLENRP